ncbi:MAG: 30S ribosomal protein S12 methylthiotransferase RimO [Deltaproteobacteria bacterium]|jgi:ribosomal protein S12 methylthiotransferase
MNVHLISLGCPRNLVDSEIMLGRLLESGCTITSHESDADCVVVNTCSFIRPAVDESIDTILEMARWKKLTSERRLIVVGCLPQRYGAELAEALPEVDVFLGTGAFDRIIEAAQGSLDETRILLPRPDALAVCDANTPRFPAPPPHTAYLKVAEGCSGQCTYCIIPKLRGPQRSRPMEDVLSEARRLVEAGARELILVAQNTTAYGEDLGRGYGLEHLLAKLGRISELTWIRVLYGHPDYVTDGFIETVAVHDRVCSYFDIPIQHISEPILKRMGRRHNSQSILDLFGRIRRNVPGAVLRTTLMVGFPGETEQDFDALLHLVETVRFDHLGAFTYSNEKDLRSSRLKDHVTEQVKQERLKRLMVRQGELSLENSQKYVGRTLKVLLEDPAKEADRPWIGRASFQAPDIDGVVYVNTGKAKPGTWVDVRITAAHPYDLTGDTV